jgi:hypothetical protein
MKNALRLSALVAVLVVTAFTARTADALPTDCAEKEGAACSSPGTTSRCYSYDGSMCYYFYPCWCEKNYVGGYWWRCGSSYIQESCSV